MISIIDGGAKVCFLCGSDRWLELHHIYLNALRQKADDYGLTVTLCANCHRHSHLAVHNDKKMRRYLQRIGQEAAMEHYGWSREEFKAMFHRDYIGEGE